MVAVLMLLVACGPTPAKPATVTAPAPSPSTTRPPTLAPSATAAPTATRSGYDAFLAKPEGALRVMTYNVGWDSIFPDEDPLNHDLRVAERGAAFVRVMSALQPDVVCLQEINERRSEQNLEAFLDQVMPSGAGSWQADHVRDTLLATNHRLLEAGYELKTRTILPYLDQSAGLVDLPDEVFGEQDLYLVCSHFKAGGNLSDILLRVRQADAIMAHMRDLTASEELAAGTPYVLLGDFNIYDTDPARQLRTLMRGDIYDQARYGPDWDPDWDGTQLLDVGPSHNDLGEDHYTWRQDASPFNPRALDRIIYTNSVLRVLNSFVLNTELMTDEALERHGLERHDVLLDPASSYHDHFPVVVDFALKR